MRVSSLLAMCVLTLTTPSVAHAASSTVSLTLSVGRSCVTVSGADAAMQTMLVLKCNSGSAAPQSPLEVVAGPIADWQLSGHKGSPDGGELFTYIRRSPSEGATASVDFY